MSDNAAPAGSSTYDSSTMYVGDGTWIASKNTFLLPNLQGLNFATMQYNSMSNRFASMPEYHRLILGHGVIAAIVFLLLVPSAIFIAKFYYRNPRLALRLHIWLHILTVGLLTVVFILGWMAVGPERSLTNPHHGIGVAIYTLVMVQAIGGGIIHHVEKGKARWRLPLKLMLHQWLGRAIALLGITQIALGLTLYGSPKYLFILYALACFAWLLLYLILTYINRPDLGGGDGYGSESYVSGGTRTEVTEDRRTGRSGSHHRLRNAGILGAGLAGLAALRRRSRSRKRDDDISRTNRTDASPSRLTSRHSTAYTENEEKHPSRNRTKESHTWRNRLLGAAAGLGAYEGLKKLFGRRQVSDEESGVGNYRPPPSDSQFSRADVTRVQEGQAPMSPGDSRLSRPSRIPPATMNSPTRQGLRPRASEESFMSDDSRDSFDSDYESRSNIGGGHGIRDGIATLGILGFIRAKQRQRRDKKEQRRVDAMRREEQENADNINRANSRRYTDRPSTMDRRRRPSRAETVETEDFSAMGSHPELSRNHPPYANGPPLPASAGAIPATTTSQAIPSTERLGYDSHSGVQSLPTTAVQPPTTTTGYPTAPGSVNMPSAPVEPDPSRLVDPYQDSRTNIPPENIALANAPYSPTQSHRGRDHSQSGRRLSASHTSPASVASPPVSVKVQMHKDGRHVTLRRLNEEEAAAERDARRLERRQRRRRAESLSSGVEDESTRFRRNDGVRPVANIPITNVPPLPSPELHLPPGPPPVPAHSMSPHPGGLHPAYPAPSGLTSGVGSPGTHDTGTGTDLSAFDNNRRRRRAERNAAKERAAQQGSRVEFS